jgi:hypothetical protein
VTAGAAPAGYHVFADADVTVDENSTALAIALQGVLTSTLLLSDEAARPIIAKQMTAIKALSAKLSETFKANPSLANQLVNPDNGNAETSASSLFESAGLVKDLTVLVASALTDVASAAQDPAKLGGKDDARAKTLESVKLLGSALDAKIDLKGNKVTLVNRFNGRTADATDASSVSTASQQTRPSGGSGGGSVNAVALPYAVDKGTMVNVKPSVHYYVPANGGQIEVTMVGRIDASGPYVWSMRVVPPARYSVLVSRSAVVQVTNAAQVRKGLVAVPAADALLVNSINTYVYTTTSTIRVAANVNDPAGDAGVVCDGMVAPDFEPGSDEAMMYAYALLPRNRDSYHVLSPVEQPNSRYFYDFSDYAATVLPGLGYTRPTAGAITSGGLTFTPVAWVQSEGTDVIWRVHANTAGRWGFTYNSVTVPVLEYHVNRIELGTPGPSSTSPSDDLFLFLSNDTPWTFQTNSANAVTSSAIDLDVLPEVDSYSSNYYPTSNVY